MIKCILICVFCFPLWACAQLDTIDILQTQGPEAIIVNTISEGKELIEVDSDMNVANLLSRKMGIQIQGQGGSYLRTALYRGQSARHMAILWEGMNIQNQFNGTYDLGLIPTSLFNNSRWYHGSFSAALGTAAMSGALVLDQTENEPKAVASVQYSDQSNTQYNLKLQWNNHKIKQSFGLNYWDNANEFRYKNGKEILKRMHSGHLQNDITYNARISWSENILTKVSYWFQDVERSLPASTISSVLANQKDVNHRLSLSNSWQASDNILLNTSVGYMNEYLRYFQPGINSESRSDILNINAKLTVEGSLKHVIGVNVRNESGELQDTLNPLFTSFFPKRNTTSLFYNGQKKFKHSIINLSLRQELIGNEFQIPVSEISYRYRQSDNISYAVSLGSNFNYPGFNDLYWPLGGNMNLSTEKSYQLEIGAKVSALNVKLFWINSTDKIVWSPNEQNIWTPDNISSTTSRGVEMEYVLDYKFKEISFEMIPVINYNHTVNNAEGLNFGKQLLYNPKFNSRLNISAEINNWKLRLDHSFTSKRFQSLDNVNVLDPYHLVNAELGFHDIYQGSFISNFHLGVNNVFDQSYELVNFFPQPLRSIYFGTRISIQ